MLVLTLSFSQFAFGGDSSVKVDNSLEALAHEDPLANVEMILVLKQDNAGLLDRLDEATSKIDEELELMNEESKEKFSLLKAELNYEGNSEEILEDFTSNDKKFLKNLMQLEKKYGLDDKSLNSMKFHADELKTERSKLIYSLLVKEYSPAQDNLIWKLLWIDGVSIVSQDFNSNSMTISSPISNLEMISSIKGIDEIVSNEFVDVDESDVSIQAMGADSWHSAGYDGAIGDILSLNSGGIYTSHPSLDHINWISTCLISPPCDAQNPFGGHDTVVAGIIGGDHNLYSGVSYGVDKFYNGMTNTFSQAQTAITWAVINSPDTADHITMSKSFGGGSAPYCGDSFQEKYVDEIVDFYDVNWVKSAGNNGQNSDKNVTLPAGAYNLLAVGASDDLNTVSRNDDVLSPTSSLGPVDICGSNEQRIKPDIVAPGVGITNTDQAGSFSTGSGTSFAAPHVAASILLLEDRYGPVFSTVEEKALLFNSAEDRDYSTGASGNDGPDNRWGQGYLDMARAYFESNNVDKINFVGENDTKYFLTSSFSNNDKITSVWNRHIVGNAGVVNNLDFWLYDGSNGFLLDESNYVGRNIEQVSFGGAYNSAVLKARLTDLNEGIGEDVGIAFTNSFTEVNGPSFLTDLDSQGNIFCGEVVNVTANVTNLGDIGAYSVLAELEVPAGLTVLTSSIVNLGDVQSNNNLEAQWSITANASGPKLLEVGVESDSYGEIVLDEDTFNLIVNNQSEICFDGFDNNCNGVVNEGCWNATRMPPGSSNVTLCMLNLTTGNSTCP
ncbi:S8 family serine peptidase [archaeon]|nr:S8 family serine peptidase [archaeon]MBT6183004.1 S8 family serine peptidase [archaeon]